MSSKNAIYESSMLGGLGADEEGWASLLMRVTEGFEMDGVDDCCCCTTFGFGFGRADSLLTRTDAGTCNNLKQNGPLTLQNSRRLNNSRNNVKPVNIP